MTRICIITLLSAVLACVAGRGLMGQDEEYCPPGQSGPPGQQCLGPAPTPELNGGWNLYWHDPCDPGNYPLPLGCGILQSPAAAPNIFVTADFVPLIRDQSHSMTFQTLGNATNTALSTGSFEPGFRAGTRATVGVAVGDWYRVEGVFLGGYQWQDLATARDMTLNSQGGLGALRSPFSNFGNPAIVPGLDNNDFASIGFHSRLNGSELNVRRRMYMQFDRDVAFETSFIVGARYLDVTETFNYFSHSNGTGAQNITNQFNVGTQNVMVGPQIGLMGQALLRPNTWFDIEAKGAAFANHVSQQSVYVNNNGGVVNQFAGTAARDRNAYLGDFAFTFNHQFSRNFTLRLGYNLLVVSGLALGSQNLNQNLSAIQLGPSTVVNHGRTTYHGPTLGLTWAY